MGCEFWAPVSIPGTPYIAGEGKHGILYVVDTTNMYAVHDLGALPWVADDVLAKISESGEISFWRATPDGTVHAFTIIGRVEQDLGTLNGYASRVSRGPNAQRQIVGWSVSGKNLVDSLATTHAFLYTRGRMLDLGTLGGRDSQATGINEAGQVVGRVKSSRQNKTRISLQEGKLTDLGTLPGVVTALRAESTGAV